MNEHFVTSREWSERLKKAGVLRESEFYWFKDFDTDKYILITKEEKQWKVKSITETCSAFLTDELAGMLPLSIRSKRKEYWFTIRKWSHGWSCGYLDKGKLYNDYEQMGVTLPNALAAMVEYLRKEKII